MPRRPKAFNDDRGRLIQMIAPHLAFAIRAAGGAPPSRAPRSALKRPRRLRRFVCVDSLTLSSSRR